MIVASSYNAEQEFNEHLQAKYEQVRARVCQNESLTAPPEHISKMKPFLFG